MNTKERTTTSLKNGDVVEGWEAYPDIDHGRDYIGIRRYNDEYIGFINTDGRYFSTMTKETALAFAERIKAICQ